MENHIQFFGVFFLHDPMQKLCNLWVPSTSTLTILQGITCFTWNYRKITAHISELHMCCHLWLKKRCLCLALYFYLKHADWMASPVLSINAFGLFELHVSCQDQEDGAGWRRWGLYPHLLVLSAAWETHGQDLQRGNFAPFSGDLLTSLESIIYLRPTSCYHIPCSAFSHFSPGLLGPSCIWTPWRQHGKAPKHQDFTTPVSTSSGVRFGFLNLWQSKKASWYEC